MKSLLKYFLLIVNVLTMHITVLSHRLLFYFIDKFIVLFVFIQIFLDYL